ncbi:DUF998 domain-containing protein [Bailinhaonella thermotolerans]|nr:DUF998 domain-containing protein [Bailinhaonella thermotolerans]
MNVIRVGAVLWVLALQNLIVEIVAAGAWRTPYSFGEHAISDLGNTACAPFEGRDVCSPLHAAFNASQVAFGVLIIAGAALTARWWPRGKTRTAGLILLGLAGAGAIGAALVPENVDLPTHNLFALVAFAGQNIGLLVLAAALWRVRRGAAVFTLLCGAVGLVATAMLVSGSYAGLGFGGIERVAANPFVLWLLVTGVLILVTARRGADAAPRLTGAAAS